MEVEVEVEVEGSGGGWKSASNQAFSCGTLGPIKYLPTGGPKPILCRDIGKYSFYFFFEWKFDCFNKVFVVKFF